MPPVRVELVSFGGRCRVMLKRTGAHVNKKEQATNDRQCLEEVVPGDAKRSVTARAGEMA